jgi:ABC-2 type transport system permease protein
MKIKRITAILKARFREYYRDTSSWAWNLFMPIMILLGFTFIFSGESQDVFKVAVYPANQTNTQLERFIQTKYVNIIESDDLEKMITRVERHQVDMLIDSSTGLRYWINEYSPKGYLVEKLLRESLFSEQAPALQREVVSGRNIRYADWLLPGVLAMNMMFSCLWGVGWVIVRYRKNGVLRRLQATTLTPFEFLTAQVFARLIIITATTIVVYLGADLIIDFTMRGSYLALFLVFFSGAACLTSMGLIVATRLKTEEVADGLLNLMSWPMMVLSGVWFSMEGTHPAAQYLSQLFPLTHIVDAARQIMIDGAGVMDVAYEIGLLWILTVLFLTLSARLFRWS